MDRVALDLGFIQVYWYSIFIFLGILTGFFFIYKEAKRKKINDEILLDLIFNSILIGIIGARLYYVIFNLPYYLSNIIEIFEIWNGGLAIHGGIISALIFIYYYCKKHDVKFIDILDIFVVGLIIGQAIGRWGNFFNQEAYGGVTTYNELVNDGIPTFIINGMFILGEYRQPTFFYESLWCLFGFISMIIIRRLSKTLKKGQLTSFYLIWYGIARLFIEGLRTDSLMLGPIKIAQVVSVIFIVVGLYLFIKYKDKKGIEYSYNYIEADKKPAIVYFK